MGSCRGPKLMSAFAVLVAASCVWSAAGQIPVDLPVPIVDPLPPSPPPFDCKVVLCSLSYDPVCAPDGYSYVNECIARCSDEVNLNGPFTKGLCPLDPACSCLNNYDPVCDASGKTTWQNACNADCARAARPFKKGPCPDPCAKVSLTYAPVCGKDGVTYHNRQLLNCSGAKFAYVGTCRICPKKRACLKAPVKPVCGSNKKTYCNSCVARQLKVTVASQGHCKTGTCLPSGSVCLLAKPKCCKGTTCYSGPVQSADQVKGVCRAGPLPIG